MTQITQSLEKHLYENQVGRIDLGALKAIEAADKTLDKNYETASGVTKGIMGYVKKLSEILEAYGQGAFNHPGGVLSLDESLRGLESEYGAALRSKMKGPAYKGMSGEAKNAYKVLVKQLSKNTSYLKEMLGGLKKIHKIGIEKLALQALKLVDYKG